MVKFNGIRELAAFLTRSEETHTAFVQQLFHYLVKQPIRAFGPQALPDLRRFFAATRFQCSEADGRDHGDIGFDAPRE